MKRKCLWLGCIILGLVLLCNVAWALESSVQPTGVLRYDKDKAQDGYTLITWNLPPGQKTAYLIDMEGFIVHKWKLKHSPGEYAMLLPNGNLLAGGSAEEEKPVNFGGASGYITEYDWDGNEVWEWKEVSDTYVQHHAIDRLPNGNTLFNAWEYKSYEEAIAKGRDPSTLNPDGFKSGNMVIKGIWPDYVKEVSPDKKVVWEWHVWDHLGTGPKQIDINFILPKATGVMSGPDWTHFNTASYYAPTDKVILNSRNFSETYIIDHKTGEMEYRWGNPCAYGAGKCPGFVDDGDQQVFGEHDASLEENGNLLIFDNGWFRPEGERSRVIEVDPKTGRIVWQFHTEMAHAFNSRYQGAVHKLPNGNYFITSTNSGHLMEVTGGKNPEIVWEWYSPLIKKGAAFGCFAEDKADTFIGGGAQITTSIHRAFRYPKDYPAFKGKDLGKKESFVKGGCVPQWKLYEDWKTANE